MLRRYVPRNGMYSYLSLRATAGGEAISAHCLKDSYCRAVFACALRGIAAWDSLSHLFTYALLFCLKFRLYVTQECVTYLSHVILSEHNEHKDLGRHTRIFPSGFTPEGTGRKPP